MKKTLLIAACGLFAASTYAQQMQDVSANQNKNVVAKTIAPRATTIERNASAVTEARWLNWGETVESFHESEPSFVWSATLMPDTNGISGYDDDNLPFWPFIHSAAVTVVPSDPNWGWMSPYNTAVVDSASIFGWYERGTNVAEDVTDQLRFDIVRNITSTASTIDADGNTTGVFINLAYDQAAHTPTGADILGTYFIDLKAEDNTGEDNGKYFSVNVEDFAIAAPANINDELGPNVSVVVTYLPGNAYGLNDIIGEDVSRFSFASLEEYGQNTTPDDYLTYNSSFIISTDIRYNLSGPDDGNWNGSYIPSIAYNQPGWSLENHLIDVKLISNNISVDETNEVAFNVYPNPSTGLVKVVTNNNGYEQNISIKNILGQEVMNMVSTNETEDLDMTSYRKGIYFLTVTNGDSQVTKKVTIQ